MAEEPIDFNKERFRRIDEMLRRILDNAEDTKMRLGAFDQHLAGIQKVLGGIQESIAALNQRMDRSDARFDRIERRLDLAEIAKS